MLVERLGRFSRRLRPGIYFLYPFIEQPRRVTWRITETYIDRRGNEGVRHMQSYLDRVDLRESVMDFPMQAIITRDNVEIKIHPMLLYRLHDPVRVAYEVYDLPHAVEKIVQTTLRSIIGDMGLDDTLASREEINRVLSQKISAICNNWGLELRKVEILEILPTDSVQKAMHKQIAAERVRRASIIRADGERERDRTQADGDAQSKIQRSKGISQETVIKAKGLADAKVIIATAEANAVKTVAKTLDEYGIDATQYLIGVKYIEAFSGIARRADVRNIFFPYETGVVGALATVGS